MSTCVAKAVSTIVLQDNATFAKDVKHFDLIN
jgi:hypothetical protein